MTLEETPRIAVQLQEIIRELQDAGVVLPADLVVTRGASIIEDAFTVAPTDIGGQVAGKGFEFQDICTVFLMTKFLDDDAPLLLMRMEGSEDIDLLTRQDGGTCEWYYQIKTIKEGTNWTLRMFDTEGVWQRFAHCTSEFRGKCSDPDRRVRVVLVVDGDVDASVQAIRGAPLSFVIAGRGRGDLAEESVLARVRGEALFSVTRHHLVAHYATGGVREALKSQSAECVSQLRELCSAVAQQVDSEYLSNPRTVDRSDIVSMVARVVRPPAFTAESTSLVEQGPRDPQVLTAKLIDSLASLAPSLDLLDTIRSSLADAYLSLDPLFASLQVESRIGFAMRPNVLWKQSTISETEEQSQVKTSELTHGRLVWHSYLEDSILRKLLEGTHLAIEQARIAYDRLRIFVRRAASAGLLIDRSLFLMVVSSVPRVQMENVPETTDLVQRPAAVGEITDRLAKKSAVYLYGFPKVGKTKLAAMVARVLAEQYKVFWHTIEAGTECADRLVSDFSYFVGELAGSRNLYVDWVERKQPLSTISRGAAVALEGCNVLLVLDNYHALNSEQKRVTSDLLQPLLSAPRASVKVLAIGEDRTGLPPFVSPDDAMRVGGLSFEESVELLKVSGCSVSEDNLLEFIALHSKIDGHPSMLLIVARNLGSPSSAQEVSGLTARLADLDQDTARFFDQLAHGVFSILTTPEQAEMLRRLSVLPSGFDRELCFAVATCQPVVSLRPTDWLRLVANVLDRSHRGKYVVPDIFKQIAADDVQPDLRPRIYKAAADHILAYAIQERRVDFWDFQDAICYLAYAGEWDSAAKHFLSSLIANPSATYKHLRLLFAIFRSSAFDASNVGPAIRFGLAFNELSKIIQESGEGWSSDTLSDLLKRIQEAAASLEDEMTQASYLSSVHLATSSLYERLLLRSHGVAQDGIINRESPVVVDLSERALGSAKKAFHCAWMSDELRLIGTAFWQVLHAGYLVTVPSVEEVPKFIARITEDDFASALPIPSKYWRESFWELVSDAYRRYASNCPGQDSTLATLVEHRQIAEARGWIHLQAVIGSAIGHWYFARTKEYERAIEVCDGIISAATKLGESDDLLQALYTLRADSEYALKRYENALTDYGRAAALTAHSGPLGTTDVAIRAKIGDCHWYLADYRAAAASYLRALRMRNRASGYRPSDSFRLLGKLSLAYHCMGLYWEAIRLHEKMLSLYERVQDETMFVRTGGSLLEILAETPGSKLDGEEFRATYTAFVQPRAMGPTFYDIPLIREKLAAWLERTSLAGIRYLLAQAYDLVGDTGRAIEQAKRSLATEHTSNYVSESVLHSLVYGLLSELHLKNGSKMESARAAFACMALTEDYLKFDLSPRPLEGELVTEEYVARAKAAQETTRGAKPSEYAQFLFRKHVEPSILQEINERGDFEDQATYFLALVDLALKLPLAIRPCIEAWVQLYLGIFYLARGFRSQSGMAFERMNQLVSEHSLLSVEIAYLFHTTFSSAAILHPSAGELTLACVRMALKLIERLPNSRPWLDDYNKQIHVTWRDKVVHTDDDALSKARGHMLEQLQGLEQRVEDAEGKFFHVCAVLLGWIQELDLWTSEARALQQAVLCKPLVQIDQNDRFRLYDEFGSFSRREAQHHILAGNLGKGQEISQTLALVMFQAIEWYGDTLSQEQLERLVNHQKVAALWS